MTIQNPTVELYTAERSGGEYNSVANIKRFLERWMADPQFREFVKRDPEGAVSHYRIAVDPLALEPLYHSDPPLSLSDPSQLEGKTFPLPVMDYIRHIQTKLTWRDSVRAECAPRESRFRAWRERQVARTDSQFSPIVNKQIIHAPFAFELCNGCSVGCWFCGISAPKLSDIFFHTEENAGLWRSVLEVMSDLCGPAARHGFCYWATDPLDNPDYEKFLTDFHEIIGEFPSTTTALAAKDPERTRALLRLAAEKGCRINRFSVISMGTWDKIHKEFSAEELLHTECLALNRESDLIKANAGRFRDRAQKNPDWYENEREKLKGKVRVTQEGTFTEKEIFNSAGPSSIACVSGFLINMLDHKVKLISPCVASDRWPLGYMIFNEGFFETPADLVLLLEKMISESMPETIDEDRRISFRPDLRFELVEGGFQVATMFQHVRFVNPKMDSYLADLGEAVCRGQNTAGQISLALLYQHGVPPETTLATIGKMLQRGILNEEPPVPDTVNHG